MKKPSAATVKKPSAATMIANLEKRAWLQRQALDQAVSDLDAARRRSGLPTGPDLPWQEDAAYGFALLEATLHDARMTDDDLRTQVKWTTMSFASANSHSHSALGLLRKARSAPSP